MVEGAAFSIARNITNGIILQVCDLQKLDKKKEKKIEKKEKGYRKNEPSFFTMFASEFLGTALLLFLGCMGCITQVDNPAPTHHMSALAFGFVILLIIQTFGHISGAHLNPAVTIAAVIHKIMNFQTAIAYIAGQFLGATLGFALLKALAPAEYVGDGFCMTLPHEKITTLQAMAIELVITTTLIIVVCAVWDKRNAHNTDSTPIRFALVVVGISMAAGPLTGASMNTARTFGPALIYGNFKDQWVSPDYGNMTKIPLSF
ncbi:unnamed protein product [Acanthoscelides obtectus]|uniref:Uncharacterized protein n=1 Tax=Acanthoscelides obtectus TaxID=200917 RepID=A0A9P0LZ44_ACAOB|nr:unnamed protein product [Acanthoscelides obtectus]CAK1664548.1 Aquaporin AQPAe.a [Acanthoscelides obtectus]